MPQLRILVGYETEHRTVGKVLASGPDLAALQVEIDKAPPEIKRFELGTFFYQRKGRRNFVALAAAKADDGLDGLTIEELKGEADDGDIELTGAKTKQDHIDIIRAFVALEQSNNAKKIQALAKKEGVEASGRRKTDFINAIVHARRKAGNIDAPAPNESASEPEPTTAAPAADAPGFQAGITPMPSAPAPSDFKIQ